MLNPPGKRPSSKPVYTASVTLRSTRRRRMRKVLTIFEALLAIGVAGGLICAFCLGSGRGGPPWLQTAIAVLWVISIATAGVGLVGVLIGVVTLGKHDEVFPLRCVECGYERGQVGESVTRCPECGSAW